MKIMNEEIKNTLSKLTYFEEMYQQIRIIDPINKKILNSNDKLLGRTEDACYGIWQNKKTCENCISMRAYNDGETTIKIEHTIDKVLMVTAIPMSLKSRKVVVELIKDITNSMVPGELDSRTDIEIKKMLNKANLAVITDGLTNIYNKRYILEKLPVEIALHNLEKKPMSIIMADIDFFKKINDTYGHLGGDHILSLVASILKNSINRDNGWVGRFGGEEFLICLVDTKRELALELAEKIRQTIEATDFTYDESEIKITCSFGVFAVEDDYEKMREYKDFIENADKNLYTAKQNGRNRIWG